MANGISLCLIVKNEEKLLPGCLESAASVVDEVIVVDTGSSDGTRRIASEFGAKISTFDFTIPNFAGARNQSIEGASQPWILVLDADERLTASSTPLVRKLTAVKENVAYVVRRTNFGAANDEVLTDHAVRLFRNNPKHRYHGRVHETIDAAILETGGRIRISDIAIDHVPVGDGKSRSKSEFYLQILTEELRQDPQNIDRLTFLCAELHKLGRLSEASETAERIASLSPKNPTSLVNVGLYRLMHRHDRVGAEDAFRKALAVQPNHERAFACLKLLMEDRA